jgi:hypothetical protein
MYSDIAPFSGVEGVAANEYPLLLPLVIELSIRQAEADEKAQFAGPPRVARVV